MNCPHSIAEALLDIVTQGILRCRAAAWSGDAERCAIEADHIHNLPNLIKSYSNDLLESYWTVERPAFRAASSAADVKPFEPLWARLGSYIKSEHEPAEM
jgi:hypothetical protein